MSKLREDVDHLRDTLGDGVNEAKGRAKEVYRDAKSYAASAAVNSLL